MKISTHLLFLILIFALEELNMTTNKSSLTHTLGDVLAKVKKSARFSYNLLEESCRDVMRVGKPSVAKYRNKYSGNTNEYDLFDLFF